jgi:hypothetical protein
MSPASGEILLSLKFYREDGGVELPPGYQNLKVKREGTRKYDSITATCVKYDNIQPNDPVAFNDYHVGDDVQYVASKCV